MIAIPALWMPIVLSGIAVFLVSSILHMALKYHAADYKRIPNEADALAGLSKAALPPGYYHFPYCSSMKEMNSPEGLEKLRRGPVGMLTVLPNGPMAMGKTLGTWFIDYLVVFRFVGAAAFLAYGVGQVVPSIWMGMPWSNTVRAVIDGLVYSLVTGGCFGWLWPR
jgi:hypothetical protein